jgi:DNA polymerase/3'-5' exonuclease PolX
MKYADALRIAESLVERFRPACERIEIKGSVSRMKSEPRDIEILAIPLWTIVPKAKLEFGKPVPKVYKSQLDLLIDEMANTDICYLKANGEKYKKLWMIHESIQVDLFLVTPPAEWGVQSVIRTGPADFSHWMVTRKSSGGALPNEYIVANGAVGHRVRTDKGDGRMGIIPMPEEIDFFKICGLEWVEPSQRVARWAK